MHVICVSSMQLGAQQSLWPEHGPMTQKYLFPNLQFSGWIAGQNFIFSSSREQATLLSSYFFGGRRGNIRLMFSLGPHHAVLY